MSDNPSERPADVTVADPETPVPGTPVPEAPRPRQFAGPSGHALEVRRALDDAECLLHYAAQAGIDIPTDAMSAILDARQASGRGPLEPSRVVAFLAAYSKLAAKLAPVTAETVRASNEQIGTVVKGHGAMAIFTTIAVVALSLLLFVTTSISKDIADGIGKTNDLAAIARFHVGAPAIGNINDLKCGEPTTLPDPPIVFVPPMTDRDMIIELQTLAASTRDLHTSAIKLNRFVGNLEVDPFSTPESSPRDALQLPPSLSNFRAAAMCKIATYQQVRSFAQNVKADSVVAYGSLAAYVLPVLFALLGALAFNLRDYTNRVRTRTYHPSYVNSARIIVAVIAGAIISLFSGFTQGMNLPPLAIAFLVGYGVEIFFAFLDTILVTFGAKKEAPAPSATGRPG